MTAVVMADLEYVALPLAMHIATLGHKVTRNDPDAAWVKRLEANGSSVEDVPSNELTAAPHSDRFHRSSSAAFDVVMINGTTPPVAGHQVPGSESHQSRCEGNPGLAPAMAQHSKIDRAGLRYMESCNRPRRAQAPIPRDLRASQCAAKRLLITRGSGFLGEYVLAEAFRRRHQCAALPCSDAASRIFGRLESTRGEPDEVGEVFAEALVKVAKLGFRHVLAVIAAACGAGIGRGIFISTTTVMASLPALNEVDPASRDGVDHPSANHHLWRTRRLEPVPFAPPAPRSTDAPGTQWGKASSRPSTWRTWPVPC